MRKIGNPTLQEWEKEQNLQKIEEWAGQGLTTEQIAANIGISRTQFWKWRKASENIVNALKKGDEIAVNRAEQTLYDMATSGNNIAALIFYLKNKRPDKWRDKRDTEISGAGKMSFEWGGDDGRTGNQNKTAVQSEADMA